MFNVVALLRTQGSTRTGAERFVEGLESRCLLSVAAPAALAPDIHLSSPAVITVHANPAPAPVKEKVIPLDYYAGAGTLINAYSPASVGTPTAPAAAPTPPAAPPNVGGLEPSQTPSSFVAAAINVGGRSADLVGNNSFTVASIMAGPTATVIPGENGPGFTGSGGVNPFSNVEPQFPLSSAFMSVVSGTQLFGSGGALVSVFAGGF